MMWAKPFFSDGRVSYICVSCEFNGLVSKGSRFFGMASFFDQDLEIIGLVRDTDLLYSVLHLPSIPFFLKIRLGYGVEIRRTQPSI